MGADPPHRQTGERRRDPLRRFWARDAMRELAEAGEIDAPAAPPAAENGASDGVEVDAAARSRPG